jgi:DNA mismatch repair protein MutL
MQVSMNVADSVGRIHILPVEVAGRIAAGEVVERPAAVVRELIDNSLDAGSSRVTIDVTDGGRGLIRVTDDGEGLGRADAQLAFRRHATSKLRTERDLWSITTLGFRGEALPSIAAVSKVRLMTACRHEPVGTLVAVTGGTMTKVEDVAAAPGTLVEVTDLFFNTPARKKFLKAQATEFSHICQVVQQAALAWLSVQFQLRHNGQEVATYPAAASWRDRLLQVYGAKVLEHMVDVRAERPGLVLHGLTIDAAQTRVGRTPQDLFVNHRAIKNAAVAHAVYDGYGTFLAKGRHPRYVLFLDVDPERVDVNVHPAKREVRFTDQDLIHQTVRQAVREALGVPTGAAIGGRVFPAAPAERAGRAGWISLDGRSGFVAEGRPDDRWTQAAPVAAFSGSPGSSRLQEAAASGTAQVPLLDPVSIGPGAEVIPLGQVSRTFLVAQIGSELSILDQHTAHERVLFERLWRAWQSRAVESQPLLIAEPLELAPSAVPLVQRHVPDLEKLGLLLEPFGSSSFVVRAVPALLGRLDYQALIQDLVDDLSEWNATSSLEARVRPVLASLACHAAVRAGRAMEPAESKKLIEDWVEEGLPMTCPHGRRVALRLAAEELDKIFGRA